MKYLFAMIFILGCGKATFDCSHAYSEKVVRFVGPFERAKCEPGEVVVEAYLEYEPGGQPKWLKVECSKLVTSCK